MPLQGDRVSDVAGDFQDVRDVAVRVAAQRRQAPRQPPLVAVGVPDRVPDLHDLAVGEVERGAGRGVEVGPVRGGDDGVVQRRAELAQVLGGVAEQFGQPRAGPGRCGLSDGSDIDDVRAGAERGRREGPAGSQLVLLLPVAGDVQDLRDQVPGLPSAGAADQRAAQQHPLAWFAGGSGQPQLSLEGVGVAAQQRLQPAGVTGPFGLL